MSDQDKIDIVVANLQGSGKQQMATDLNDLYYGWIQENMFLSTKNDELKREIHRLKAQIADHDLADGSIRLEQYHLLKENQELKSALAPFVKLAENVIDESNNHLNRVLYAFNQAEITYQDLRNAIAACKTK